MGATKDINKNNCKTTQNGKIHEKQPEKVFMARNSLLTDLYKNEHINVLYRTFWVALILLHIRFAYAEYVKDHSLTLGAKYIIKGFGNFDKLLVFWTFMFCQTMLVYPIFYLWSKGFETFVAKKAVLRIWNYVGLLLIFAYYYSIMYVPLSFGAFTISMATNGSILCEQIRFMMKTHAFLRHNCPRILSFKPHSDKDLDRPKFSSFFYYLFAPTLVYRDEYPRTKTTNWRRVFLLSLEFFGCMFWSSFLLDTLITRYKDFGLVKETYSNLILSVMDAMLVSPFFLLAGFYILLQVWLNIWSELLKFADRKFYADWWTSQSFSTYYRNWNLPIHDYLHTYIYKDLLYLSNSKILATQLTFFISILFHEYIIALIIGFFLPILAIHFMTSAFLVRIENVKFFNNILLWALPIGTAMELCCYTMEYYARINCPIEDQSYWKYFQIRMFTCNGLNL